MDRHYTGQAHLETSAGPSFIRGRHASARDSDKSIWRIFAVRYEISLRRAVQVSGKDRRGDVDASVHHIHRSFFIMRRGGHFIIAERTSSATRFDDSVSFEGPKGSNLPSRARTGRTGIGATSSLPDALAKVRSQSDLPTFVIVRCRPAAC
jgi:hypothetical protein